MSDETTTNEGWSTTGTPGPTPTNPDPATPAGFCQNCGRPVNEATVRNIGSAVYCEPCLTARTASPYTAPGYTTVPPYATVPVSVPGAPSPVLAGLLGFIPGVGAMYNGQFAKGIIHLVIFAVLVTLSDNVNGIFGLFVAGWVFYMAFEAYHTARARLEGLPLPNAFGFNDIGERMGFGKSWATYTVPGAPAGTATTATPPPSPGFVPDMSAAAAATPSWVGYVPPTAFASAAAQQDAMAASIREQAMRDAGYYPSPYAATYTGPGYAAVPPAPLAPLPDQPARRFPVGAIWLIALGVLILLANLIPDWRMNGHWWPPILFAGLSVWLFTRRVRSGVNLICIIRWPVILMVLAIMSGLHAADYPVTFGLTVSVLLIAFGALLVLERTVGAGPAIPIAAANYSVVPPSDETQPEAGRATWPTAGTEAPKPDSEAPKGGY
jgi:hypothetical protein